jgi:hypothetical protein
MTFGLKPFNEPSQWEVSRRGFSRRGLKKGFRTGLKTGSQRGFSRRGRGDLKRCPSKEKTFLRGFLKDFSRGLFRLKSFRAF